jgi:hypothetical protein
MSFFKHFIFLDHCYFSNSLIISGKDGLMKKKHNLGIIILLISFLLISTISAQFVDDFNIGSFNLDSTAMNGWWYYTGDGSAGMKFLPRDGYTSILVDATDDQRNIWWALIRRYVSENFELSKLSQSKYELRIEARIRVSHAPRRVNLHINTQRTTDFHSHLMEFDIPDTLNWYTISMTTHKFDARPGDRVYGQLALMDWGLEKYQVDLDYFKVDIVDVDSVGPDKGIQVPYHPPVPDIDKFAYHIPVDQDAVIDREYPDINFNYWSTHHKGEIINLLTVSNTQFIIMRWNMKKFTGSQVKGSGLLELNTYSLQCSSPKQKDWGMIRVVEILRGDHDWDQKTVTYNTFTQGEPLEKVLNSQMIIDTNVTEERDSTNLIIISHPVLQRLIDGKTLGLAIRPLGAVNASFYAKENQAENFTAKLHFNINAKGKISDSK